MGLEDALRGSRTPADVRNFLREDFHLTREVASGDLAAPDDTGTQDPTSVNIGSARSHYQAGDAAVTQTFQRIVSDSHTTTDQRNQATGLQGRLEIARDFVHEQRDNRATLPEIRDYLRRTYGHRPTEAEIHSFIADLRCLNDVYELASRPPLHEDTPPRERQAGAGGGRPAPVGTNYGQIAVALVVGVGIGLSIGGVIYAVGRSRGTGGRPTVDMEAQWGRLRGSIAELNQLPTQMQNQLRGDFEVLMRARTEAQSAQEAMGRLNLIADQVPALRQALTSGDEAALRRFVQEARASAGSRPGTAEGQMSRQAANDLETFLNGRGSLARYATLQSQLMTRVDGLIQQHTRAVVGEAVAMDALVGGPVNRAPAIEPVPTRAPVDPAPGPAPTRPQAEAVPAQGVYRAAPSVQPSSDVVRIPMGGEPSPGQSCVIGRGQQSHVRIPEQMLSRRHAEVTFTGLDAQGRGLFRIRSLVGEGGTSATRAEGQGVYRMIPADRMENVRYERLADGAVVHEGEVLLLGHAMEGRRLDMGQLVDFRTYEGVRIMIERNPNNPRAFDVVYRDTLGGVRPDMSTPSPQPSPSTAPAAHATLVGH